MAKTSKILVVDDELSLVELCRIILENAGFHVQGAVNGEDALELVKVNQPDLVLLDVMMPGMDGIEVCKEIRSNYSADGSPCIVMYTADGRKETRENSLAAGANDLINKEIPIFELPARINNYLH